MDVTNNADLRVSLSYRATKRIGNNSETFVINSDACVDLMQSADEASSLDSVEFEQARLSRLFKEAVDIAIYGLNEQLKLREQEGEFHNAKNSS